MTRRSAVRGSTLLIVMIFLLLIALGSISAFRASTTNLRATNTMMIRQEAFSAAQAAIETTISSPTFQSAPAASAPFTSTVNVDVDGDATNDYAVTVTPGSSCSKVRRLLNEELPKDTTTGLPTNAWIRCDTGSAGKAVGSGSGSAGLIESDTPVAAATGKSFCVETHWNVQAQVTDTRTGTVVELNQGAAVPYAIGESKDRCARNN